MNESSSAKKSRILRIFDLIMPAETLCDLDLLLEVNYSHMTDYYNV